MVVKTKNQKSVTKSSSDPSSKKIWYYLGVVATIVTITGFSPKDIIIGACNEFRQPEEVEKPGSASNANVNEATEKAEKSGQEKNEVEKSESDSKHSIAKVNEATEKAGNSDQEKNKVEERGKEDHVKLQKQGMNGRQRIKECIWSKRYDKQKVTWKEAITYCQHNNESGYSDWHLPSINELKTIEKSGSSKFGDVDWFWSSNSKDDENAWGINFANGKETIESIDSIHYVYCVRCQEE